MAFTASSLHRLWPAPATRWLLTNRRYIGVSFAASHALHLAALISLGLVFPDRFRAETPALVFFGGGIAYLFIAAMALTSSNRAQVWLGRRWRLLHLVGGHYIWLIFAGDYLPAAFTGPVHAFFALLVLAAIVLRQAARYGATARGPARAAAQSQPPESRWS